MRRSPAAPLPARGRLPLPLTSFVGRRQELADLAAELAAARLVTLVGAGGMGKTRLALRHARTVIADRPDGIWFVELATLPAGATIDHAVAAALGFQPQAGIEVRAQLREGLAAWNTLLILDNCEHVLDSARELAGELLAHCPGLSVLATSRAPLRVPGERVRAVGPLDAGTDAAELLVERATAARPDLRVGPDTAATLTAVCEHLDGMPLAIELAAARLRSMTPVELLDHLDQRFRLLRVDRGAPGVIDRHATLGAVVDWSYDLLTAERQRLLVALGTFVGGFDLAAAHALRDPGPASDQLDTLDLLQALVDQSLVQTAEVDGRTRYALLETVRRYAVDHQTAQDRLALGVRHADHFLELARTADRELRGREQAGWLRRLEREHDNLRAALAWSLTPEGDPATAVGLGAALGAFWRYRNHLDEGADWLARILDLPSGPAADVDRARDHTRALIGAGLLDHTRGAYEPAGELFERARAEAMATGDGDGLGWALHGLGRVALARGDRTTAEALLEESNDRFARHGDRQGAAYSCLYLAATLAGRDGDVDRARRLFDETIEALATAGDTWGLIGAYAWRSAFAARFGQERSSAEDFGRALAGAAELGSTVMACTALFGLGRTAARRGCWVLAAQLLGAAQSASEAIGSTAGRTGGPSATRLVAEANTVLGTVAFDAAWADGRRRTFRDAVALGGCAAAKLAATNPLSGGAGAVRSGPRPTGLTEREWELARLVGEGRSNRQIADELQLSVRTVENHLSHVYAKLDLAGRSELIVLVHRRDRAP